MSYEPSLCVRTSCAWRTASTTGLESVDRALGRRTTRTPSASATAAISSSSVVQQTVVISRLSSADRQANSRSETPSIRLRFFRGTPFDPPRAGTIPRMRLEVLPSSGVSELAVFLTCLTACTFVTGKSGSDTQSTHAAGRFSFLRPVRPHLDVPLRCHAQFRSILAVGPPTVHPLSNE